MKKEINTETLNRLNLFKLKMLMHGNRMFFIRDFKIKKENVLIKGNYFRKEKTVEKIFLISLEMVTYFDYDGESKLGVMYEDDAYYITLVYDLPKLRKNWVDFKKQLKCFGININKKEI